jgi:K+-sensing histidine kinase KdpD
MVEGEVISAERAQRLRERAERERRARIAAEEILEQKTRELFHLNQQLERLVAERTRALNLTLENISQGIMMLGKDGHPHVQNRRAAELLELCESQSVESAVASLLSLHKANAICRFETTRPSGRVLEVRVEPLVDGGAVLTLTDISDVKSRESELRAASAAAQTANEAKSRFLSTMSHEMRTPLNGVIGSLELLSDIALTQDQRFYVDTALKASEALLVQINDVLDFSKLDAGKLEMASEPLSLERLAGEVAQILRPQAALQRNVIVVDVSPRFPELVLGDEGRLRQVLLNLVGNAVKFTVDGSGSPFRSPASAA